MRSRTHISVVAVAVAVAAFGASAADSAKRPTFPGPLYGVLLGSNEIGANGAKRAGDKDGRAAATAVFDPGSRKLCYGLTVKGLDQPVAAHIHRGIRGSNGSVVVTLAVPESGGANAAAGCTVISTSLARSLTNNPHRYYWNVHTKAFPNGAVRGQVFTKTK